MLDTALSPWPQSDTDCYSIDKIELHLVSESDEMRFKISPKMEFWRGVNEINPAAVLVGDQHFIIVCLAKEVIHVPWLLPLGPIKFQVTE